MSSLSGHAGAHSVAVAQRYGVTTMFTLSGGHVFPLYDGAVKANPPLRLVDVRHEQTAVFAAEGIARLTRTPGLAAVTAGPGVTNTVSAVTSAWFNGAPVVVLGGRAPDYLWGKGALQEMDHVPLLAPVTKRAWTEHEVAGVARSVDEAFRLATTPHRGPVFVDFPLEAIYGEATVDLPDGPLFPPTQPGAEDVARICRAARDGAPPRPRARLRRLARRRGRRRAVVRGGPAAPGNRQRPGARRAAGRPLAAGHPGPLARLRRSRPGDRGRRAAGLPAALRVIRAEGRTGFRGARGGLPWRHRDALPAGGLRVRRPVLVLHGPRPTRAARAR